MSASSMYYDLRCRRTKTTHQKRVNCLNHAVHWTCGWRRGASVYMLAFLLEADISSIWCLCCNTAYSWLNFHSQFTQRKRCVCRLSEKFGWELFDIECLSTTWGEGYVGEMSRTISGIECQEWSEQWPHPHSYDDVQYFADYSIDSTVELYDVCNYCRNPVTSEHVDARPWCFTMNEDIVKEFCDIPRCKRKTCLFAVG